MIGVMVAEDNSISMFHAMPFDEVYGLGLSKEVAERQGWKFFDEEPQREENMKVARLMYDAKANSLYYAYSDPKPTTETEVERLKAEVERLTVADLDNKEMINRLVAMVYREAKT